MKNKLLKKMMLALVICIFALSNQVNAHGVQVAYRILNTGFVRIYIEHWHGDQTLASLAGNGMSITTTYGTTTVTQNLNATDFANNTALSNLPGAGSALTVLGACSGYANTYNDWAIYDFAPATCGVPISITLNSGNTVVLTEACTGLYPITITHTFVDNNPPVITSSDITVTSCTPVAVTYTATAVGACDPNPTVTYSIASGSTFNPGTTQVTVTATDHSSPTHTSTSTFNVHVNPPALTITPSSNIVCVGGTLNLSVNTVSGATYSWTGPNGFSSTSQNPSIANVQSTASGTYNVTVTVGSACAYYGSVNVNINEYGIAPSVTTTAVSNITATTATSGGTVGFNCETTTARGICWNTTGTPTVSGNHTSDGTGAGSYASTMTGLTIGTTYYVRSYATNAIGTSYGQEFTFVAHLSYCTPVTSSYACQYMWITNVATTGGTTNFNNSSACSSSSYTDYSSSYSVSQVQGSVVNMSLSSAGYPMHYSVWVDFNDDGTFASEEQVIAYNNNSGSMTVSTGFTIPTTAPTGTHKMRVRSDYYGSAVPSDPCAAVTYGESEDYSITVNSSGPSNPTSVTASSNTICNGTSTTLTCNGAVGTVYWYTGSCGGTQVSTGNTFNASPSATTTYYARNYANGNFSTGCANVTITVNPLPTISCPGNQTANNTSGSCNATLTYSSSATGTPTPVITYSFSGATTGSGSGDGSGSTFNLGVTTVTLTATNSCDAPTCSFTVTVQDNIAPTVNAQNVTLQLDANGSASLTASQVDNGSTDNCSIASLSLSKTSFDCSNVGANTDTLTVTDASGNVANSTVTITVQDNIAPTATAQNVDIYLNASGAASTTATAVNNGSTDNCSIASLSLSKTSFDCSNVGANTDTLTVTDVNGNISSTTATVTVHDNIAPTATAQNVDIYLNASGTASTTATAINNGSTDNCSIASISLSKTSFNCSNIGANTDTLTVTDVNGNVSSTTATVTVHDNIAPTAIAQNVTVTLSGGAASITAVQVNNGSYDNCSVASMNVSPNSFTCANIGNNTVTLTVTDVNGNVSTTISTVNVIGAIPTASIAQGIQPGFTQGGAVVLTASSPTAVSYNWTSGPTTTVYNVYASGNYTVTVTNSYGCTANATTTVTYNASNMLSSYSIIGKDEVEIKDHSTIYNGGVGVTSTTGNDAKAEFEDNSNATATGTFVRARKIETENNSVVTTKILTAMPVSLLPAFMSNPYCSNNSCSNSHHGSCSGSSCTNTHHNSCTGGLNKNIGQSATVTITDSVMGQVVIGNNATVTFTSPRIYMKGLEVNNGANVIFNQCAVIKVCNNVNIHKAVNFNTTNSSIVTIYTGNHLNVDEGSHVTANVYSQEEISIKGKSTAPTVMRGMFIGEEVEAESYVNFYWNTNTVCSNNTYNKTSIAANENGLIKNYFDVNVYPNPALTNFNVRLFSSSNEPFTIEVFDMTGKLIESAKVSDSNLNQNMGSDYSDGMYIIKITQGENVKTARLVKITK